MSEPARGIFVTGTGTEVGKTVVAAVIARTAAGSGAGVGVFKPCVTGLEVDGETDIELLRRAAGSSQSNEEISPYQYGPPASPHLAAEMARERIDPQRLLRKAREAAGRHEILVCEGVGGLFVPLNPDYLVLDFAVDLGLPVVIAASPGLGTINHTLLTIEAAREAGLDVRRVVLTPWPPKADAIEESNLKTIADLGKIEVTTLPRIDLGRPEGWPRVSLPR